MFDPFGLRKEIEPAENAAPGSDAGAGTPQAQGIAAGGSEDSEARTADRKRLAVQLSLSLVLMLIFGGALALLLYIRFVGPESPARAARKLKTDSMPAKLPPPPGLPPETVNPKPEKKPELEPEKRPYAPKKPEPHPATPKSSGPTGSPGVHAPALPKRASEPISGETQSPATAKPKPAGAAGTEMSKAKGRAKAVEFAHKAPNAAEVLLKAPFLVRTGGKKPMSKGDDGVWRISVSLLPGQYKYHFLVDGKKTETEMVEVAP